MTASRTLGVAAALIVYYVLTFGFELLLARAYVLDVASPPVSVAVWCIRFVGGLCAFSTGLFLGMRARLWNRRRRILGAATCLCTVIVYLLCYSIWLAFGVVDSDYSLVTAEMLGRRLPEPIALPASASHVRAVLGGGLCSTVWMRFEASPAEAQAYLERALVLAETDGLKDNFEGGARALTEGRTFGWRPSLLLAKSWWTPEDNRLWWYKLGETRGSRQLEGIFIQVGSDTQTVFVMWWVD
jgi:hypothetical protein